MEIDSRNLLFPGDEFTLKCEFKEQLKYILSHCRSDHVCESSSSSSSSSSNSNDDMCGVSHPVIDYRKMCDTIDYMGDLELEKAVYSEDVMKRFGMCEVKKGATFDVLSLLSERFNNSNHLIRIINGQIQNDMIQVDCLKGKFIILCCVYAPYLLGGTYANILQSLSLLSHELFVRSDVYMVLAIKVRPHWSDYHSIATQFVSTFSCLAVPFHHLSRIDSICMCLNLGAMPTGVLVDRNQVVIQDTLDFVFRAGIDAFPFTDTNILSCRNFFKEMKSLEQILSSNIPSFPYRICSGEREVASVSELGQKVVGLYLLITGSDMPLLRKLYKQCQDRGFEFEVVVFCMPFDKSATPERLEHAVTSVLKEKKLPWWVFPFNSTVFRRLRMRSSRDIEDRLFIVLPDGKLMDPHGELVIHRFGIDAYPFTREGVVMKALDKIRRLTLESTLLGGFLYCGIDRVSVAHLRGRNVILCLDWVVQIKEGLDALLIRNYSHLKAKDPHMEVVYACLDTHLSHIARWAISHMPWLVYHRDPSKSEFVAADLFFWGMKREKMVAFGKDGRISSLCAQHHLRHCGPAAFPFSVDLVEEIYEELNDSDSRLMEDMVWSDRS